MMRKPSEPHVSKTGGPGAAARLLVLLALSLALSLGVNSALIGSGLLNPIPNFDRDPLNPGFMHPYFSLGESR